MWNLDQATFLGRLELPQFSGSVRLACPSAGFIPDPGPIPASDGNYRLALDLGLDEHRSPGISPVECFVRGTDLVAYYPETARQLQPQVYWRAIAPTADTPERGLEVIASMQTDLLDSAPQFVIRSELSATEVLVADPRSPGRFETLTGTPGVDFTSPTNVPTVILTRSTNATTSYVEMTYPGDGATTRCVIEGPPLAAGLVRVRIEHQMLREFLEKGVIRRCRLRGLMVPRVADERWAWQAFERFCHSELPLTA